MIALTDFVKTVFEISEKASFHRGASLVDKGIGLGAKPIGKEIKVGIYGSKGGLLGITSSKNLGTKGRMQQTDRMEIVEEDERGF